MELVLPLRDVGRGDLAVAGGKGANLGELVRAGFAVPDGFVITTAAYAAGGARHPAPSVGGCRDDPRRRGACCDSRRRARRHPDAYERLGAGRSPCAPARQPRICPARRSRASRRRSSTCRGDEELLDAVRRCWASLWSDRASRTGRSARSTTTMPDRRRRPGARPRRHRGGDVHRRPGDGGARRHRDRREPRARRGGRLGSRHPRSHRARRPRSRDRRTGTGAARS